LVDDEVIGVSDGVTLVTTIAASLAGAHSTYFLTHKRQMNSIRAASLSSLLYATIAILSKNPLLISLQPAFFGSTYVSMSEPHRLSEKKVLIAAVIFGCILFTLQKTEFVSFQGGIGGTLGGSAFLACVLVYWIQSLVSLVGAKTTIQ
jgi:ABC-type amino acid transport system permease subunit